VSTHLTLSAPLSHWESLMECIVASSSQIKADVADTRVKFGQGEGASLQIPLRPRPSGAGQPLHNNQTLRRALKNRFKIGGKGRRAAASAKAAMFGAGGGHAIAVVHRASARPQQAQGFVSVTDVHKPKAPNHPTHGSRTLKSKTPARLLLNRHDGARPTKARRKS
jgi:hypothetical protein